MHISNGGIKSLKCSDGSVLTLTKDIVNKFNKNLINVTNQLINTSDLPAGNVSNIFSIIPPIQIVCKETNI